MRKSGTAELVTGLFSAGHPKCWEDMVFLKLDDFSPITGSVLAFFPTKFGSVLPFKTFSVTLFDFTCLVLETKYDPLSTYNLPAHTKSLREEDSSSSGRPCLMASRVMKFLSGRYFLTVRMSSMICSRILAVFSSPCSSIVYNNSHLKAALHLLNLTAQKHILYTFCKGTLPAKKSCAAVILTLQESRACNCG